MKLNELLTVVFVTVAACTEQIPDRSAFLASSDVTVAVDADTTGQDVADSTSDQLDADATKDADAVLPSDTTAGEIDAEGADVDAKSDIGDVDLCADVSCVPKPCLSGSCNPATGQCIYLATANTSSCDDENACTVGDHCEAGACLPGDPTACVDTNACTTDTCDPSKGCVFAPNQATCTDGNACTGGDACAGGACVSTGAKSCDDTNPCTDDACDQLAGCVNLPNAASCTDGKACTKDACQGGKCVSDDGKCDDGNACTVDICASSGCKHVANDQATCETDDNVCTTDVCVGTQCGHLPKAGACEDGSVCTLNDVCAAGTCTPGAPIDCEDGNVCTLEDGCDDKAGCVHVNLDGKSCNDKNACSLGDECKGGFCAGIFTPCDDGNPCTTEDCNTDVGCKFNQSAPGSLCAIDNTCTNDGLCCPAVSPPGMIRIAGGVFWMGCSASDLECDSDEVPQHKLTMTTFDMDATEVTSQAYKLCVDAGVCTVPQSLAGTYNWDAVNNAPKLGREQHPINGVDYFQARTYCRWRGGQFEPAAAMHYDTPSEAQFEMAVRGSCEQHGIDPSSDVTCAAAMPKYPWGDDLVSCVYAIIKEGGVRGCGASTTAPVGSRPKGASLYGLLDLVGNVSEWVRDGYDTEFFGTSGISDPVGPSTSPFRVIKGGNYSYDDTKWNRPGFRVFTEATTFGSALGLRCVRSCALPACATEVDCNDLNGCTTDVCGADGKCSHVDAPAGSTCTDGDACTTPDVCAGASCVAGSKSTCDDGNACTSDSCDKFNGCLHEPVVDGSVCSDGDLCTSGDACATGVCVAAATQQCDDGNACTTDSCDKLTGCQHSAGPSAITCGANLNLTCDGKGACVSPPTGMVLVPPGTFWMGCNIAKDANCAADVNANPQHKVSLSAFFIDATEVTAAAFKTCVDAAACGAPGGDSQSSFCNWDTTNKKPKTGREQHPVNCVNWTEAAKFCKWHGKQTDSANANDYALPTEAQWELAARGDCEANGSPSSDDAVCKAAMRTYPWGEASASCSLAVMFDGVSKGCGVGTTAQVGSKVGGDSPYGLHDMAGNVQEWVRDWFDAAYYATSPLVNPVGPASALTIGNRGGGFGATAAGLRAGARSSADPAGESTNIGFRCVRALP